jgi:hypothetical protein
MHVPLNKEQSMKPLVGVLIAFALVVPCLAFGQAAPQKTAPAKTESVADQIMALEQAWLKADLATDPAWFEKYLADSYDGTDAFTGQPGTKAQYLADVKAKAWTAQSAVISDMKVQAFGDFAVVTGITTAVKASHKGEDRSGKFRWTDTWVRRNGAWQCVASQSTKMK